MFNTIKCRWILMVLCSFLFSAASAQSILPPVIEWHGLSESLIVRSNDPWITPAEKSGFVTTPDYTTTMNWFRKLTASSSLLKMVSIGKSVEGRDIFMIIASSEKNKDAQTLKASGKALLLAQAGIHSGEIDGKDAGMMLLRDIAIGKKKSLLDNVNFLFIPILSVDAHERSSAYNRPNQRGPENMGWRTNAQNLNLNRDYTKLDTREIRSVIRIINEYEPDLYMDIHVTDGADYQYDITYGGIGKQGYSPAIRDWLENTHKKFVDKELTASGHIPGPLLNAFNDRDFSKGNVVTYGGPRFSDSYGDVRHLASILVENHSLKPYKQRVLGTYVLLESTLKLLATSGQTLKDLTKKEKAQRAEKIPTAWKIPQLQNELKFDSQNAGKDFNNRSGAPDSIQLSGIASAIRTSTVTGVDYIEWLGKKESFTVPDYKSTEPMDFVTRPKGYWVPASCDEVIARLKIHGIQMETVSAPREVNVEMYRITDFKFEDDSHAMRPFEGHFQVNAKSLTENHLQKYAAGSVYISTDQPLGDLAILLLEPLSKDSYFSWGFFNSVFQRTEYIEAYVMEPMAKKMLADSPMLQKEFEEKKATDKAFAGNPYAILTWFYSKTKFYDERYLLYPVGRVLK